MHILISILLWSGVHIVHMKLIQIFLVPLSMWFIIFLSVHFSFLVMSLGLKMVLLITGLARVSAIFRHMIETINWHSLWVVFYFVSDTIITWAWENSVLISWLCIAAFSVALQVSIAFWRKRVWIFCKSCSVSWHLMQVTIWSLIRESWHSLQKFQVFDRIHKKTVLFSLLKYKAFIGLVGDTNHIHMLSTYNLTEHFVQAELLQITCFNKCSWAHHQGNSQIWPLVFLWTFYSVLSKENSLCIIYETASMSRLCLTPKTNVLVLICKSQQMCHQSSLHCSPLQKARQRNQNKKSLVTTPVDMEIN